MVSWLLWRLEILIFPSFTLHSPRALAFKVLLPYPFLPTKCSRKATEIVAIPLSFTMLIFTFSISTSDSSVLVHISDSYPCIQTIYQIRTRSAPLPVEISDSAVRDFILYCYFRVMWFDKITGGYRNSCANYQASLKQLFSVTTVCSVHVHACVRMCAVCVCVLCTYVCVCAVYVCVCLCTCVCALYGVLDNPPLFDADWRVLAAPQQPHQPEWDGEQFKLPLL